MGGTYTTTVAAKYTGNSFTDTTITNGTTYVVMAIINGIESGNSNEASATPTAPVITGNNAILEITMVTSEIKEYDLTPTEIQNFLTWYDSRVKGLIRHII
ncbi:MAG: Carbohydrate binding family 6 [Clostridiaceae bacterium]|nr:Carbohydrate binding family 6 [Clostridiaceae bacterium]